MDPWASSQVPPALAPFVPFSDEQWSPDRIEKYSLEEIATFMPTPILQENTTAVEQKPFPFLSLPGEIRNLIYRHALVSPKTYTVKLQFFPTDTALLRVNKQIYAEASAIFYHENIFWFPQTLFVGGPILERLERVYHLPPRRLQIMRNFVIDIPIYGFHGGNFLYRQVRENNMELLSFLLHHNDPGIKVSLDFLMAWGESDFEMLPFLYVPLVDKWTAIKSKAEVEVVVRTAAFGLDFWVDYLGKSFGNKWFVNTNFQNLGTTQQTRRWEAVRRFRERYQMEGLIEHYCEKFDSASYSFAPRRTPS